MLYSDELITSLGVAVTAAKMPGQQHRHHVCRRHARRRLPGPGGGAATDRVHPQLLGELANLLQSRYRHGGLLPRLSGSIIPVAPTPACITSEADDRERSAGPPSAPNTRFWLPRIESASKQPAAPNGGSVSLTLRKARLRNVRR